MGRCLAWFVVAVLGWAALAPAAHAQGAPDDRYAKRLAKEAFVEGRGFPGVVAVGTPTPEMYKALGPPREAPDFVFWYFYDRGPWTLVVVAELDNAGDSVTRALEISGDQAPATQRGVRIGDPVAKVTKLYGAAEPFSASVGSPQLARLTSVDVRTGKRRDIPDTETAYQGSLFYPALSTLFVVAGDKVERIVVVQADDPLPVFLRDPATVKPSTQVVIDPKVDAPTRGTGADTTLHVPPPPPLVHAKLPGATLDVPRGWRKTGTTWTDASGKEQVSVTETRAGGTPEAFFAAQEASFGDNRVPPKQRALPADFATTLGVDHAYALWRQVGSKGKHDAPLRSFVLLATKGERQLVIVVSRTASGALPSPDGETLARGVLRSFRAR